MGIFRRNKQSSSSSISDVPYSGLTVSVSTATSSTAGAAAAAAVAATSYIPSIIHNSPSPAYVASIPSSSASSGITSNHQRSFTSLDIDASYRTTVASGAEQPRTLGAVVVSDHMQQLGRAPDVSSSSSNMAALEERSVATDDNSSHIHREQQEQQQQIGTLGQLVAGGVAGAFSKTCTAPLARLTILFQVQGMRSPHRGGYHHRTSMLQEASRIVREEGVHAFWKGNMVTIIHRLPYSAINFFAYEKYKLAFERLCGPDDEHENLGMSMATKLMAGGGAGVTAATLTYPLDLIRTRLAAQTNSTYYRGIVGTFMTIAKDEGPAGLYKGMGATLLGVGPNLAINFCVYDTLKAQWIARHPDTPPALVSLGCGSLAGICSSTATFPLDLVRRRMQLEGAGGKTPPSLQASMPNSALAQFSSPPEKRKVGIVAMTRRIVRTEGWIALYRGILPEYLKVVPGVSIAFMTYEFMRRLLRRRQEDDFTTDDV